MDSKYNSVRYMRYIAKKIGLKRYTLMNKTELRKIIYRIVTDPSYVFDTDNFTKDGLRLCSSILGSDIVGDKTRLIDSINNTVVDDTLDYYNVWNDYLKIQ